MKIIKIKKKKIYNLFYILIKGVIKIGTILLYICVIVNPSLEKINSL